MFNYFNHKLTKTLLSIFFFILIALIINNEIIGKIIWWFPDLFGDLKTPIKWLECHNSGFDYYNNRNAFTECSKREFNYGKIFLETPYIKKFNLFYIEILPYLLIFFSIFFIVKIFPIDNYLSLSILIFTIFNPSTFLLFSGANIDLLIFLLLIFTTFNRIYFINWFLYFYLTFIKIYPIVLFLGIFFENKNRNTIEIIAIYIILFSISLTYLYFNFSEYVYFLNNLSGAKAGYHYLFSLNSFAKIFKYLLNLNYIFLLIITYILFFYLVLYIYKKIVLGLDAIKFISNNFYNSEFKLFIISSYLTILCYVFFSNFFHREIFLIGIIPFILKFHRTFKMYQIKYFVYLILIKFIFSYFYSYVNVNDEIQYVNNQRIFSNLFIIVVLIKAIIDYLLMILVSALSLLGTKIFFKELKYKLLKN